MHVKEIKVIIGRGVPIIFRIAQRIPRVPVDLVAISVFRLATVVFPHRRIQFVEYGIKGIRAFLLRMIINTTG
jgi:hypothetical protein